MKRIIIINLALWLLASCNQMQDIGDVALSPDWRFSPGNDLAWAQPGFDDSGWTTKRSGLQNARPRKVQSTKHVLLFRSCTSEGRIRFRCSAAADFE